VKEDTAGARSRDRRDDPSAARREALEVGAVVERRRVLGVVVPAIPPELGVIDVVERQVNRLQPIGTRRDVGAELVVVAQVDDRPDPVRR
jgi:hypothetical protein